MTSPLVLTEKDHMTDDGLVQMQVTVTFTYDAVPYSYPDRAPAAMATLDREALLEDPGYLFDAIGRALDDLELTVKPLIDAR